VLGSAGGAGAVGGDDLGGVPIQGDAARSWRLGVAAGVAAASGHRADR
jgi:hypothetical protein